MVDELRVLRVNAVELLRQPGATRPVDVTVDGATLGVVHDRLAGAVGVAVVLEAMNDGIVVSGEIRAPWATECRRCLADIHGTAVAAVDELYQIEVTDPDAYQIENNQLDLVPMIRELGLLELDGERVCRAECAGLCPVCGVDLNATTCTCDTTVVDDRWAALDGLVLDD